MSKAQKLGIWLDHSAAHLIEFSADKSKERVISSKFTHERKNESYAKGENAMHSTEQQLLTDYFKGLGEIVKGYKEVLLFGPTDAKVELANRLRQDHAFSGIKFKIETSDKMTENQRRAFVTDYFTKHPS
ncbi:MAG TPA: hypothetical protein VK508_15795 [Cyclobacteriaceae bacterium]|nr:hypothetical protein [Cyclobacteriaceae bacterium]